MTRRIAPLTLLVGLLAACPAQAAGQADSTTNAHKHLIPVWALIDGSLPVVGGKVRVVATDHAGGPVVRPGSPGVPARTNGAGAFVLDAAQVPRNLTVIVSGGKVGGRPFRGDLAVEVRGYRAPAILYANPVSTIVASYRAAHEGMSLSRATARVKRFLAIPKWHDLGQDLRRSARYFSGRALLDLLGRRHDLQAVVDRIIRRIDASRGNGRGPIVGKASAHAAQSASASGYIIDGLAKGVLSYEGGQGFGWLLGQFGIGTGINDQISAIRAQLAQISQQLGALQSLEAGIRADVRQGEYSTLYSQIAPYKSDIDYGEDRLSYIAGMSPDDPTKAGLTSDVLDFIHDHLLSAENRMRDLISPDPTTGADGIVVALYKSVFASANDPGSATFHFWTPDTSDRIQGVFDFYTTYQAVLATLIVEYEHAKPTVYSPQTVAHDLAQFTPDLQAEAQLLKPPVPPGTALDTQTGLMLSTQDKARTSIWNHWPIEGGCPGCGDTGINVHCTGSGPCSSHLYPNPYDRPPMPDAWDDWRPAALDQLNAFTSGWSGHGKTPFDFLHDRAGLQNQGPGGDRQFFVAGPPTAEELGPPPHDDTDPPSYTRRLDPSSFYDPGVSPGQCWANAEAAGPYYPGPVTRILYCSTIDLNKTGDYVKGMDLLAGVYDPSGNLTDWGEQTAILMVRDPGSNVYWYG